VPTDLQRQGIFTEAIAGRVPAIYDPASGATTRTPFAGGVIPADRIDPVARTLLERYPRATSAGTANNFRRTAPETDDQNQWTVRVDHRWGGGHDHLFGRLTNFRGTFLPVAPLPDGSGVTSGTLGPQDTVSWAFASRYQRAWSASILNEVRAGDTRRSVDRTASQLASTAGAALNIRGIPANARFPNTLPTFLISGYQQLGSPPNTASAFNTSVTEIADTLTWITGRHTLKAGFDWRWERLNVVQPPSPTGSFTFNAIGSDLPGVADTGTPFASFLLGQVQSFSIDLQQEQIQERASFQEYFVQDDWKVSERLTISPGLRYTLNFPSTEINGQTAVLNLETQLLEYPGAAPVRPLKKNNFGPRLGVAYRVTDKTLVSTGYGMVWIEMAGITTPFTTPTFPFLQTVSQRALDTLSPAFVLRNGPDVAPIEPTPTAGLGQGVFSVDGTLGSGYVQQWNASVQRELTSNTTVDVAYIGSTITHVGIPDTNLNQLTVDQLALGAALLQRVPNPLFGVVPRSSSLGDPTIPVAQLLKPFPQYTTVSLYRNNVGTTNYHGVTAKVEQRFSRGLSYLVSYTRSRLMDDASSVFDASILTGPVANVPVADSFNRALERDYSTGDIPHVFVASAVWEVRRRACIPARGRPRRAGQRLVAGDGDHVAVRSPDRGDADDELQRLRRLRHAATEPDRRSRVARRRANAGALVQHRGVRDRAAVHARNVVAQPGARSVLSQRGPVAQPPPAAARGQRDRAACRGIQSAEYAAARQPERGRRIRGIRQYHHRRRPAGHSTRGEVAFLARYTWRVSAGSSRPSTAAVHVAPGWIGVDSVSVPELTRSPAASGSAPSCLAIAEASSARQSAGLRSELRPDPCSTSCPSFARRTLNFGSCSTSSGMSSERTGRGVPTTSAACRPQAATKSGG
jgi:hypothetical protein